MNADAIVTVVVFGCISVYALHGFALLFADMGDEGHKYLIRDRTEIVLVCIPVFGIIAIMLRRAWNRIGSGQ